MTPRVALLLGLAVLAMCGSTRMLPQTGATAGAGTTAQDVYKGPMGEKEHPVRVSSGVMMGLILNKVWPVYPQEAIDAKVNGAVVMMAKIDKEGKIVDLKVISGPQMLRDAMLAAVRQWTFKPYLLNGQPVFVQTTITITD
jgi:protein TonB